MTRYFNERGIELLAPVGNFEIFKEIINTKCDAVYLGGKKLNNRMHRKDFNFSHDELKTAVSIALEKGKKIYVTVNNLHDSNDIDAMKELLHFLNDISPDAIIVQDMTVIDYVAKNKLKLPLHASVMMNVHNFNTVKVLGEMGVSRVVMCREVPLSDIKAMSLKTEVEFEYFVHGDMCAAHGAHCYYSSFLFGKSSNRGLCLKPCRWPYKLKSEDSIFDTSFPIAAKDMFLYENIPELIQNNVTSFKIEGRMRDAAYLTKIINSYADAIDRYIDNPLEYDRQKDSNVLHENRKRDFHTFYALGHPGINHVDNDRFEGTNAEKTFSTASDEKPVTNENTEKIKNVILPYACNSSVMPPVSLSVSVNTKEAALKCIDLGVEKIYLFDILCKDTIKYIMQNKKNTLVYLSLPPVMYDNLFDEYEHFLKCVTVDGLLAGNSGAISVFTEKGFNVCGDYFLNIYNAQAARIYLEMGLSSYTASIEAPADQAVHMIAKNSEQTEFLVWGFPVVMIFEYDLFKSASKYPVIKSSKNDNVFMHRHAPGLSLVSADGFEHPLYKTHHNTVMLSRKPLALMPLLRDIAKCGLRTARLDCLYMQDSMVETVVKLHKKAFNDGLVEEAYNELCKWYPQASYGAFEHIPNENV